MFPSSAKLLEFYGLPVLDLFSTSGLQPKVDIIKETYMPTDCIPPMQVHCGSHCGSWDFADAVIKKDDAITLTLCYDNKD